jgi:hypothetical protein
MVINCVLPGFLPDQVTVTVMVAKRFGEDPERETVQDRV